MKSKSLLLLILTLILVFSSVPVSQAASSNVKTGLITQGNYYKGFQLWSNNGKYLFTLQNDGNVVIYNTTSWKAIWVAPNTWNNTDYIVFGSKYGFQCVKYDTANSFHFSYQISAPGSTYLCMQDDGNLVIYNSSWKALWGSGTYGM